MAWRRPFLVLAVLSLLFLPGCLEFKKQTLIVKFDDKSDKITCMSIYEGFYAGEGLHLLQFKQSARRSDLDAAKTDLSRFVGDKRSLYLLSGLLEMDLDPDPTDPSEGAKVMRRLAPFLQLDRGKLFFDA